MHIIVGIIIFLGAQLAYGFDPKEPVPICMNDLPHRLKFQEVACSYFNKDALLSNRLRIVRNGLHEFKIANSGLKYRILNLKDSTKPKPSNDAFITGLSICNEQTNRCYIIGALCDESDIHNAFHRIDIHSLGKKKEFLHIGFRITDDCDDVHGALNEPSCFVLTVNKRTLAIDMDRFYYETPRFGDDQLPFDNSDNLKYSKGYKHVPIK